ncbi:hypothetical protein QR680_003163 [Steinernema hermaphroditum]|uniref:Uncharacterized protein n=1 Tax=Steinernema hermaphroditum TaxID=289476 RepID=A0AA39LJN7_9BILA|nr:hypothetical protein QR680_003163 [Steinernema hermaphroditum]
MEKALQYRSADNVSLASNLICLPAPLSECELVIDGDAEDERHNHSNGQHVHMIVTPSPERNQHNEKSKDAAVQSRRKLTPSPDAQRRPASAQETPFKFIPYQQERKEHIFSKYVKVGIGNDK